MGVIIFLVIGLGIAVIAGFAATDAAEKKGNGGCGWGCACFLFPPLVLIPLLMGTNPNRKPGYSEKQCPFCAEIIKSAAVTCRYCGKDLNTFKSEPLPTPPPAPPKEETPPEPVKEIPKPEPRVRSKDTESQKILGFDAMGITQVRMECDPSDPVCSKYQGKVFTIMEVKRADIPPHHDDCKCVFVQIPKY